MKRYYIILCLLVLFGAGCKKDNSGEVMQAPANFNVINTAIGAGSVKVNPDAGKRFTYNNAIGQVGYGGNFYYQTFIGNRNIAVVSAADTTKTFFSGAINFTQPVNTLYLIGQSPAVDTMFRQEVGIPYIPSAVNNPDSSLYVRFVNLSPNSTPLNVKMNTGTTTRSEFSALAYKGISAFKKYDANFKSTNYVFEVWNTANTSKLASITLAPASLRYKTLSVIVRGIMADPLPVQAIPNQLSLFQVVYF